MRQNWEAFGIEWSWFDWSLSRRVSAHELHQLFGLKCGQCRRFSFGCGQHWFCGTCEPCKVRLESDDEDALMFE